MLFDSTIERGLLSQSRYYVVGGRRESRSVLVFIALLENNYEDNRDKKEMREC